MRSVCDVTTRSCVTEAIDYVKARVYLRTGVYLNSFPQISAFESGLELQLPRVRRVALADDPLLVPVAEKPLVARRRRRSPGSGARESIEIVDDFLNGGDDVEAAFHAGQQFRATNLPILGVERLDFSRTVAADQIRIGDLDEADNASHFARHSAVRLSIRDVRRHVS